jgi:ABC-type Fe3+ transport system permease subunit
MNRIRSVHLLVGLGSVALFLATGQYMHHVHDHLANTPDAPRLLFRSSHIYLLLAALCNVALGLYLRRHGTRLGRSLQAVGSLMLLVAPLAFAYSFFVESTQDGIDRSIAGLGAYLSLFGMSLHALSNWVAAGSPADPT